MQPRIMYVERGGGLAGLGGRIGKVCFSKTGKTLYYGGKEFKSLNGSGYKTNYFDLDTGEEYWISGPKKDGTDALYPMVIEIDSDIREEYWSTVRMRPDDKEVTCFRAPGKYSKRRPHPGCTRARV